MLTGANGQVGWELARSLLPLGEVVALNRSQCDLSKPETLPKIVEEIKPDVIVNAAAYTAVDKAEEEEALATIINGTSVGVLAEQAKKHNALFIHYSTDYVFDGTKSAPYTEEDKPNPINAYGRTKLIGERQIQESGCDYLVFRTSWIYSARGYNFMKTILRLASEKEELRVVADQLGSPTWARNIADVTSHIISKVSLEKRCNEFISSILNMSSEGATTWFDFTVAIVEAANLHGSSLCLRVKKILPIATSDYPTPAKRPLNSRLNSSLLNTRFGLYMPEWIRSMSLCIDELY